VIRNYTFIVTVTDMLYCKWAVVGQRLDRWTGTGTGTGKLKLRLGGKEL
jgi:hypothetical protein